AREHSRHCGTQCRHPRRCHLRVWAAAPALGRARGRRQSLRPRGVLVPHQIRGSDVNTPVCAPGRLGSMSAASELMTIVILAGLVLLEPVAARAENGTALTCGIHVGTGTRDILSATDIRPVSRGQALAG